MGSTKSVLRNCYLDESRGTRTCRRNKKHKITKGQPCLAFKESMQSPRYYCIPCGKVILEKGREELDALLVEVTSR